MGENTFVSYVNSRYPVTCSFPCREQRACHKLSLTKVAGWRSSQSRGVKVITAGGGCD